MWIYSARVKSSHPVANRHANYNFTRELDWRDNDLAIDRQKRSHARMLSAVAPLSFSSYPRLCVNGKGFRSRFVISIF